MSWLLVHVTEKALVWIGVEFLPAVIGIGAVDLEEKLLSSREQ